MGGLVSRRWIAGRSWPTLAGAMLLPLLVASCASDGKIQGEATVPGESSLRGAPLPGGASVAGNFLAGRFAQDHHDLTAASDYLQRALAGDPENLELLQRTYIALAIDGRLDEAAVVAKRLLQFDGEAGIAALLVAEQDARAGNWAAVEQRAASLPHRGLTAFMGPLVGAWAKVAQGRTDAGLEALAPLAQNSNFAALHDFHSALINDLADRRKAAEQDYLGTLAGSGGLTLRTVESAAAFYRRTGQNDKANAVVGRYLQQHPESESLGIGLTAASRPVATPLAGLAEAYFGAAGSLRQGSAPDLALIFGRMALDLDPDMPLAQLTVADTLQGLGRLEDANVLYAKVPADSPVFWSAKLRLAANQDDLGDVDGAVQTLEAISAQFPQRSDALLTLGDVLRRHQRWSESAAAYDRAIALLGPPKPDQWPLYYSRGIALERSKQWTRAETDFLTALQLQPDQPHVLNYLGYSWIEQGVNLDQARQMIEKAVEQRPTDGFIVDSLGWVYYRLGDPKRAVEVLQKAVELNPEDATINDHLGDALWVNGRREEARFQWQRALISNPEPELKATLDEKLKDGLRPVPFPAGPIPVATPATAAVPAKKSAGQ